VVAAITPWNFPLGMPLSILIPALGAGNAVVFKPSEHVPLTGALIFDAIAENVPEGVIQLVQGAGDVGAALVEADVDMIGFVGSRDTGKRIMKAAAGELKRLVLELGGKDPVIVFADSDLEAAAECVTGGSLRNTGQVCCSVERVFVEESVAKEFESKVLEKAKAWTHGDGFDADVKMGPLVSVEQRDKVAVQVTEAVRDGARLLLGGETPAGPGAFYPATLLADVDPALRVARDETFGPVICLSTFSGDEAEAIRLGNDTPYGLGASVWSGDIPRGQRVAARLHAGQVGLNRYLAGAPGTPWVGARQSGFGFLGGPEGHRQFTTPKTLSVPRSAS
jgi:acyl-CoA reductase-like NAD-dependent aldehyde dehydrogenase